VHQLHQRNLLDKNVYYWSVFPVIEFLVIQYAIILELWSLGVYVDEAVSEKAEIFALVGVTYKNSVGVCMLRYEFGMPCQVIWYQSKQFYYIFGLRPSDHYFRSVCWFVRLFVQSFSRPSFIRFR